MNVTVIGAGNSGLAMAAHLSREGNKVTLWNRSRNNIPQLMETRTIHCEGAVCGQVEVSLVTDDIGKAVENPDLILITTPANAHRELAELIAKNIRKETLIVLNPGRTLGALEFKKVYEEFNKTYKPLIAETQTTIYTCRKTAEDSVSIISFKNDVLISAVKPKHNKSIIEKLPKCIREFFSPASSMIQTSIGNVGMILHCAPLLLNAGWTENKDCIYKYYYDGITPTVASFIEKIDHERVQVSKKLGLEVESTKEWMKRTYNIQGDSLYECIQNNEAYKTIDAPHSLNHRYIMEDVPFGLVPLEAVGRRVGLDMKHTSLIIDLASAMMNTDFRRIGRNLKDYFREHSIAEFKKMITEGGNDAGI
ncbi:MAG: NAD(P)-binding domain-containing protein [Firmicutes bacterium]|nr:NAD(P)-binding domain-containing protein [Bacillota bacterium]HOB21281.1 NAD/NADP octopine/nopaline dehydrogenase family protein [Bacillota bacterium]